MTGTISQYVDSGYPAPPDLPAWDGELYAANTAHHRAFDDVFLASTPLLTTDRVLDVGCGSGDLTATIAGLVPDGHVVGVDAQPSMLEEARRRARPNQSFVLTPAQRIAEAVEGPFDVVVSRAVLHWLPAADWPGVLRAVADLVRPGGWVRIECGGGPGNVARLRGVLDEESTGRGGPATPWTFHDAAGALDLVEAAGLDPAFVRTVAQRRPFDRDSLVGWLRSQCFQGYEAAMPGGERAHAAFRAAVEARLDDVRRADGTLDQTFVRLDLLVRRPG